MTEGINARITLEDGVAELYLREPTNEELSKFLRSRTSVGRKGRIDDRTIEERIKFFDLLFTGSRNLEDAEGNPIGKDDVDKIRISIKSMIIFESFEAPEVDIKN
jgi:hypothetical protein